MKAIDKAIVLLFWMILAGYFFYSAYPGRAAAKPPPSFGHAKYIGAPEEMFAECEAKVTDIVLQTHQSADQNYVAALAEPVCRWSWNREIDPLLVSSIISVESTWVKLKKCNANCGPMQVAKIHAALWDIATNDLMDLETNVRVGTEIFVSAKHRSLAAYNGGGTPGYADHVRQVYQKLRIVADNRDVFFPYN